jgi:hypothetical protein
LHLHQAHALSSSSSSSISSTLAFNCLGQLSLDLPLSHNAHKPLHLVEGSNSSLQQQQHSRSAHLVTCAFHDKHELVTTALHGSWQHRQLCTLNRRALLTLPCRQKV